MNDGMCKYFGTKPWEHILSKTMVNIIIHSNMNNGKDERIWCTIHIGTNQFDRRDF